MVTCRRTQVKELPCYWLRTRTSRSLQPISCCTNASIEVTGMQSPMYHKTLAQENTYSTSCTIRSRMILKLEIFQGVKYLKNIVVGIGRKPSLCDLWDIEGF